MAGTPGTGKDKLVRKIKYDGRTIHVVKKAMMAVWIHVVIEEGKYVLGLLMHLHACVRVCACAFVRSSLSLSRSLFPDLTPV